VGFLMGGKAQLTYSAGLAMCWRLQPNGMRCPLGPNHAGACRADGPPEAYARLCRLIGWTEPPA
jgi:hypothetical protein